MTIYRDKMLSNYTATYLLHGPRFLPSDAADSAGRYSTILRIPFGWLANAVIQGYTCRQGTIWVRKTIFCSLLKKISCVQFLWDKATHENFLTLKISQINYGTCMYLLFQVEKYKCMHLL